MRKGYYARTKDGYIGKIVKSSYAYDWDIGQSMLSKPSKVDTFIMDTNICFSDEPDRIDRVDVVKSSKDILELLEPMDLLYVDISPDDCEGIVVPRIPENINELNGMKWLIESGHWGLIGVVTREKLINDMYRVGE